MQGSFDAALVAMLLPLCGPATIAIALVTLLSHRGSTALLILVAHVALYAWRYLPRKWFTGIAITATPSLLAALYVYWTAFIGNGSERLHKYAQAMQFLGDSAPWMWFLGVGPGTYTWSSLLLDKFQRPMFLHLHSDWLQILFELGLVGMALVTATWMRALRLARVDHSLFMCLIGAGIFALTYHPVRFAYSAIVLCLLAREALMVVRKNDAQMEVTHGSRY
jgi:hypothetical protein